ncbi:hypothetical protein ACRQ1B_06600 [Rhizobium panacihumi]|uniref:hypothetical protein n=1 Tax=Rhizobium panacihumi TaxID=2008450 RepID=UPI003D7AB798
MPKFGLGSVAKLEKRGVFSNNVYSKDTVLIDKMLAASNRPNDPVVLVHEDDLEPSQLVKQFAELTGAKIVKASTQLPVTAVEEQNLRQRLAGGEQAQSIAKSLDLDVIKLVALAQEVRK